MSKEPQTQRELEAAAQRWLNNLAGWKRRYVESLRNETFAFSGKLAESSQEIRRLRERIQALQASLGALTLLCDLTRVPSRYDKRRMEQVRMSLEFTPHSGWKIVRDDEQGGGPFVSGPRSPTPEGAIHAFVGAHATREDPST